VHYIGSWVNGKMEFRADDISTPQKQKVVLTMTFEPKAAIGDAIDGRRQDVSTGVRFDLYEEEVTAE
jgi:hypothetical protein